MNKHNIDLKVGDKVRDLGLYPYNCDGIVVSVNRWFWEIGWMFDGKGSKGWCKVRAMNHVAVKLSDGKMKFYGPYNVGALEREGIKPQCPGRYSMLPKAVDLLVYPSFV